MPGKQKKSSSMNFTLANKLTILRIILSPVFFALFLAGAEMCRTISLFVFLIAALTDWYDGMLARKLGDITELGKFLDPLADKILTSSAFIAFGMISMVPWWMVAIIVLRDLLITALRSFAEYKGKQFITTKFAQTKTFIQMSALYYVLVLTVARDSSVGRGSLAGIISNALDPTLVYVLMLTVTILTLVTGVQYIYECRSFLSEVVEEKEAGRR
jgi:CDP-diacylglycerol--glycerol-3-phosphate 3-phosphatidyltransferase